MNTSVNQQGWSKKWFDVIALVLFALICLGGLASIFLSSSIGLALTEFFISIGGLLVSVILAKPDILRGWKQMVQGWFGTLLRIGIFVLLVLTISLQIVIIKNQLSPPPSSAKGVPSSTPTVLSSQAPSPTPTLTPTPSPPSVLITAPTDGSQVSILTTVQGTAQNIPKDEELWLFVVPSNQASYFPQPGPIKILGGKWSIGAHFGGASDVGLKFTLIPVLINQNDQEAHNAIKKYFQQPGPVYQGIQQTSGMQLMFPQITVVRV